MERLIFHLLIHSQMTTTARARPGGASSVELRGWQGSGCLGHSLLLLGIEVVQKQSIRFSDSHG